MLAEQSLENEMDSDPLISVVIPTYNQADYLEKSIQSVLNQTYDSFETLIVNDGSTDETSRALEKYRSIPSLRIINQDNKGLSAARNAGIKEATGKYIALLDSDDLMVSDRLISQIQAFRTNLTIDVVYTAVHLIDHKDNMLSLMRREDIPAENFLAEEFFRNQIPTPSTIMAKSEVFQKHLFDESLRAGEDLEWILRTAHDFTFHYLDLPLTKYRRHQSNLSEDLSMMREIELKILRSYGIDHICSCVERSKIHDKALLKGKILYVMEYFEEAVILLKESKSPLSLFYISNCFYQLKDFQMAVQYYLKSLAEDSENAACWNNLGIALLKLGRVTEAEEALAKAVTLKPGYLDPSRKTFTRRELRKDLLPYRITQMESNN